MIHIQMLATATITEWSFFISFLPNVDFEKVLIKHDKSKTGNYSQQIILNLGEEILCILMWS